MGTKLSVEHFRQRKQKNEMGFFPLHPYLLKRKKKKERLLSQRRKKLPLKKRAPLSS